MHYQPTSPYISSLADLASPAPHRYKGQNSAGSKRAKVKSESGVETSDKFSNIESAVCTSETFRKGGKENAGTSMPITGNFVRGTTPLS